MLVFAPRIREMPEMTERPEKAKIPRRLAAIIAADIAGYSALMGVDEARTVRDLKEHQAVVLPMIKEHGGRVIDTAGDGILAEFASILNAVRCAVAVQETMADRNAAIADARRMQLRIGINQGDVVFDDARVYGEGINVAARLEGIAEPGGICLSGKVYDEIQGRIDLTYEDLGAQQLKNIERPVRVYRIVVHSTGLASLAPQKTPLLALPDRPSIAVLPFANMSGDQSQDYFSDGITEDIITELSRFSELFVIARNSSFQYKDRAADARQIARELGVRYLLEGSIRRAGERVRITAQLVDAHTGAHRWAERYDRAVEDVFALQDEVARTVAAILAAHLSKAEFERTLLKPPATWQAYDYFMRAADTYASFHRCMQVAVVYETRRYLDQCLALDPNFARAYVLQSTTHTATWAQPLDDDYMEPAVLDAAHRAAEKAVQLDPNLPQARYQLGFILGFKVHREAAVAECERAVELNPNYTDWRFAAVLVHAGQPERAVQVAKAHLRVDPFTLPIARGWLGLAYYMLRRYQEAVVTLREYVSQSPNFRPGRAWLTAAYAQSGRLEEARAQAAEVLRIDPNWTISGIFRKGSYLLDDDVDHLVQGLRKAGLPEN